MSADHVRLLGHILGIEGEDWFIERWPQEYEGWAGSLRTWCFESESFAPVCGCCDPKNLTANDIGLLLAAFPEASSQR